MAEHLIERVEDRGRGGFVIRNPDGGEPEFWAEMTYRWQNETMVIVHTGVREMLRGQGIARKLVLEGVAAARSEGFLIEPICPYAKKVLEGDPSFADVLAPA